MSWLFGKKKQAAPIQKPPGNTPKPVRLLLQNQNCTVTPKKQINHSLPTYLSLIFFLPSFNTNQQLTIFL